MGTAGPRQGPRLDPPRTDNLPRLTADPPVARLGLRSLCRRQNPQNQGAAPRAFPRKGLAGLPPARFHPAPRGSRSRLAASRPLGGREFCRRLHLPFPGRRPCVQTACAGNQSRQDHAAAARPCQARHQRPLNRPFNPHTRFHAALASNAAGRTAAHAADFSRKPAEFVRIVLPPRSMASTRPTIAS